MGHFEKSPPVQVDDLAQRVTSEVSKGHIDQAYMMMKSELQSEFSKLPLDEKKQTWNALSKQLEDNGTLPKLAGAWLSDLTSHYPSNVQVAVTKGQLDSIAKREDINPMQSGMASEMSKQFNVAANLDKADGKIDAEEAASFKARQTMPSSEIFAQKIVEEAKLTASTSPSAAYSFIARSVFQRAKMETPEEEAATWKLIDDKLHANNLIPKLSMGMIDTFYPKQSVTASQMSMIERSSPNPFAKELAGYVVQEFSKIGTFDYNLNEISPAERKLYTDRLNGK